MEQKIEQVKYEFEKLVGIMPTSDVFWESAALPSLEIAKLAHQSFVQAIITWQAARRRLGEYRWPATWRDAFKERWFPAWAKKRWPVRYQTIAVDELLGARPRPGDEHVIRYFMPAGYEIMATPEILSRPLRDIGLSTRVYRLLWRAGFRQFDEILAWAEGKDLDDALLSLDNLGPKALAEIKEVLARGGYLLDNHKG